MHIRKTQPFATKKSIVSRLVLSFAGVMAAAVVGSAGVAAAHPMPQHHGNGGGNGYGGGNNISTSVNVTVNGNNNVINIVINYFFGH